MLAMTVPGLAYVAGQNTDRHANAAIGSIDDAARSLVIDESLPPEGHHPPQRIVTVTMPADSLTTHSLSHFQIERVNENSSVARYGIDTRATRTTFIDAPIVEGTASKNDTVTIGGTGEQTLALTLEADANGDSVVVVTHR